jgi:hypothetical protein
VLHFGGCSLCRRDWRYSPFLHYGLNTFFSPVN